MTRLLSLIRLFTETNAVKIQSAACDKKRSNGCHVLDVAMLGAMTATCLFLWWAVVGFKPLRHEVQSNIDLTHGIMLPMLEIGAVGLGYIALRCGSLLLALCSILGRSQRSIIGWFCVATFLLDVPIFLVAQGMVFQYLYLHYA